MIKIHKSKNVLIVFELIVVLLIMSLFLATPKLNMTSFFDGILLWAKYVMPALFPILFITSILNSSGIAQSIGIIFSPITKKLFNCGGVAGYVYVMSILSGYPVGAKITSELYTNGIINYGEACRITSFSSTSGPLFIIGTVAIGMFGDYKLGLVVAISHFLGSLVNGIFWRKLYYQPTIVKYSANHSNTPNILENCMLSSIRGILIIGGYIAISYMILSLASHYNIFLPIINVAQTLFGTNADIMNGVLQGMIEITKGSLVISKIGLSFNANALLCTGIISFGGLSIFLQALTYLNKFGIKLKIYFAQKILQTTLSITICSIILLII